MKKKTIKQQIKEALTYHGNIKAKDHGKIMPQNEKTPFGKLRDYFWFNIFKDERKNYDDKYFIRNLYIETWDYETLIVKMEIQHHKAFDNIEKRVEKWRKDNNIKDRELIKFDVSMQAMIFCY